jgi:hypothetical protein
MYGTVGTGPIHRFEIRERQGWLPRGWIDGLTLSNDTTDATNDVGIAAGSAKSTVRIVDGTASTATQDQIDLELPVSIIKQIDTAYAPENYDPSIWPPQAGGDRSGGRSTSTLSNTTWHALLAGGGGLQPDVFFHDSITQSSVLAEMLKIGGYTAYRRIGSVLRESATIVAFTQYGDFFQRTGLAADVSAANPGTSAVTRTVSVPIGVIVEADVYLGMATGGTGSNILLSALSATDIAPTNSIADLSNPTGIASTTGGRKRVMTNTSGQIRSRISNSAADVTLVINTRGWADQRDRNS